MLMQRLEVSSSISASFFIYFSLLNTVLGQIRCGTHTCFTVCWLVCVFTCGHMHAMAHVEVREQLAVLASHHVGPED